MTERERELLLAYFVNEEMRIDSELIELRNRIRFRHIDVTDNVEMMLTQQRYNDFCEFSLTVLRLLHLDKSIER